MTPSVYAFDASIGSLIAHLLDPYLTYLCTPFPHPLTTRDLSTPSSVRRFEVSSCKPTSRDLPSSLVQHRGATVDTYFYLIILNLTLTGFHLQQCSGRQSSEFVITARKRVTKTSFERSLWTDSLDFCFINTSGGSNHIPFPSLVECQFVVAGFFVFAVNQVIINELRYCIADSSGSFNIREAIFLFHFSPYIIANGPIKQSLQMRSDTAIP